MVTERALYAQENEYKSIAIQDGAFVNEIDKTPFAKIAMPLQDKVAKEMGFEDLLLKIRAIE